MLQKGTALGYHDGMIASLEGIIIQKNDGSIVLNVAGVGYRIFITSETNKKLKHKTEVISLFTHLAVRETSMDLYGFLDKKELLFFQMLISISGIGPKSALAILSIADVETLERAVSSGDSSYLTQVSGIGKKNAEKIVLELSGKIDAVTELADGITLKDEADTLEALKALGYSTKEARDALKTVPKEIVSTSDRLKGALKLLGK